MANDNGLAQLTLIVAIGIVALVFLFKAGEKQDTYQEQLNLLHTEVDLIHDELAKIAIADELSHQELEAVHNELDVVANVIPEVPAEQRNYLVQNIDSLHAQVDNLYKEIRVIHEQREHVEASMAGMQ